MKDAHSALVQLRRESLEVVGGTETVIELGDVGDPVSVVWISVDRTGAIIIFVDRTDPD